MTHDNRPSLFDQTAGEDRRDEGIAAVLDADTAVHRNYREDVERVLDSLIARGIEFSADDVQDALAEDVRQFASPQLVPALFRFYSSSGRIVQVGWRNSKRASRHAGVVRTWTAAPQGVAA